MTIREIIKLYGRGKGEETMWKSVSAISDYVEHTKDNDPKAYDNIIKCIKSIMHGCHFYEDDAKDQVAKMYYVDSSGNKNYAPYWSEDSIEGVYNSISGMIPSEYTMWDFYVVVNMIRSDNYNLLKSWWPSIDETELTTKCVEMAVSWLNDEDATHPKEKAWYYFM